MGLVAFGLVLSSTDLDDASALLAASGPVLVLALFPYLAQIGFDSLGWKTLLGVLDRPVKWRRLVAIRLSTEAVLMSMPAGSIVGETLKPYLLHKTDRVPPADTIASIGAKKCFLVFAQATYLGTALLLGWALLDGSSEALIGAGGVTYLVLGAVVFLLLVATVLAITFVDGGVGDKLHRLLMRVPITSFRAWIAARREPFHATDSSFKAIGRAPRSRLLLAYLYLVLAWFVEAGETWILLQLLGIDMPIVQVLVMESAVVFMRVTAIFVPAGLGVQDAGYLAFFKAFGFDAAAGGAFVILKRVKEVAWVGLGYLCLFFLQSRATPPPPAPEVALLSTTETA